MGINICRILFSLLLFTVIKTSEANAKILIEKYERWSHPVEAIFVKHGISLYKVSYSKDGLCPTFYAKFKYSPDPKKASTIDFHTVYSEILKANSYFPYALVDNDENIKINVGWNNEAKKIMAVDIDKASAISTCKGKSSKNIDNRADFDKFTISPQMQKRIMSSSFKASIHNGNGKKIVAYLFAEDETSKPFEYTSCLSGDEKKTMLKEGHYYLYLYDVASHSFRPERTAVFYDSDGIMMNTEGSDFFVWPSVDKNQSDIIFLSQFVACDGDQYEAYGFYKNQFHLKRYAFVDKKKVNVFYGRIYKDKHKDGSLSAYSQFNQKMYQFKLSLSKILGEIRLTQF